MIIPIYVYSFFLFLLARFWKASIKQINLKLIGSFGTKRNAGSSCIVFIHCKILNNKYDFFYAQYENLSFQQRTQNTGYSKAIFFSLNYNFMLIIFQSIFFFSVFFHTRVFMFYTWFIITLVLLVKLKKAVFVFFPHIHRRRLNRKTRRKKSSDTNLFILF